MRFGKLDLTRRRFLKFSGRAAAGVASVAVGATFESKAVWALSVDGFADHVALTLLRMARLLYPHDGLGDDLYLEIVEGLGRAASQDSALAANLESGVMALDEARGKPWLDLAEADQIAVLRDLETTAFVNTVRTTVLHDLYNNPRLWALVGFQGSSMEFGGYINRGFDDIDWLPEDGG